MALSISKSSPFAAAAQPIVAYLALVLASVLALASLPQQGYAFQLEEADPYSDLGYQLIHGINGPTGGRFTLGSRFLDGKITNPSAESEQFDRSVGIITRTEYTAGLTGFSVHAALVGSGYRRLISNKGTGSSVTESRFYETSVQLLAAKPILGDLQLVAGVHYDMLPKYRASTESVPTGDSSQKFSHIKYGGLSLMSYKLGLIKGSGNQQVGFLLGSHAKSTRSITVDAGTAGSANEEPDRQLSQVHHKPQTLTFSFVRGAPANRLRFELSAINGNRGNQNTEQGYTASDFFSVLRVGKGFAVAAFPLEAALVYKTFSYKDSSRVTVDTISAGALHLSSQILTPVGTVAVHVYGSLGKEGQSITEINRQFDVVGFGATAGLSLGL